MALVKAKFEVSGKTVKTIPVHFNPSEYAIRTVPGAQPQTEYKTGTDGRPSPYQTIGKNDYEELDFTLYFDTYTLFWDSSSVTSSLPAMTAVRGDVRAYTEEIAALARRQDGAPMVSFIWGSLHFTGTVESVDQKFTMFLDDGKPVRAELQVKMRSCAIEQRNFGMKNRSAIDLTDESWKAAVAAVVTAGKLRDILKQFA